jgi:DNA ligase (NAD+)
MEANTRIKELRKLINQYNYQYYVLDASPAKDEEYDKLYRELVDLERANPQLIDPDSPTQRVGAKVKGDFKKAKHSDRRMLSLDNAYSAAEVIKFIGTEEVTMEPKLDGASLKLIYQAGKFVQAITRGNGMEGDDVTANARTIMTVPVVLPQPIDITVVGEVYMPYSVFNEANVKLEKEGFEPMANPRNAASGAIKLKDPKEVMSRHLQYCAYGTTTEFPNITTQIQLTDFLETLGFQSVFMLPTTGSCQSVADCFLIENERMLEQRVAAADKSRSFLDLPTDGLVFKINSLAKQRDMGEGTKFPNYACAFKFPPERKLTKLLGITVQVGRTGKVTPVAELKPVLLSGTVVRRASLCNQDEIDRLHVSIDDDVYVEKSAEIIPKVVGVSHGGAAFINGSLDASLSGGPPACTEKGTPLADFAEKPVYHIPVHCPCCKTKLVKPEGYVDSFCPNPDCDDQVFERLRHACGKAALDIDGCGEVLIKELMKHGVRNLSDIFTIKPDFLKPSVRKRFEEGRATSPAQPLWRKLHALGIDGFGQTLCQEVASRWSSVTSAFDDDEAFTDLIGKAVWNNIYDYFMKNADEINALDALLGLSSTSIADGPLKGKTFCITGELTSGSRGVVSRRIEDAGGVMKTSVSRHLSYLIQGTETGQVKREKAKKYGVPVINEQQLYALMGQEMPVPKVLEEREY